MLEIITNQVSLQLEPFIGRWGRWTVFMSIRIPIGQVQTTDGRVLPRFIDEQGNANETKVSLSPEEVYQIMLVLEIFYKTGDPEKARAALSDPQKGLIAPHANASVAFVPIMSQDGNCIGFRLGIIKDKTFHGIGIVNRARAYAIADTLRKCVDSIMNYYHTKRIEGQAQWLENQQQNGNTKAQQTQVITQDVVDPVVQDLQEALAPQQTQPVAQSQQSQPQEQTQKQKQMQAPQQSPILDDIDLEGDF